MLGHFNAGFSAQDFTASLVLQASPDLRFKRATRVENACATGSAAVHQGLRAIAAKAARIVLVVGVEQMTTTPRPEIGHNLLKASYVREEAEIEGGFAGIFGKIAGALFPEIRRPVRRAGADRGQEPQERRRQSLCADAQGPRLRLLPQREREESVRRRPAQAHRLLAGLRRRRRAGAGRRRDRAAHETRRSRSAPPRMCRTSCRWRSATSSSSRAAREAWQRALGKAGADARRPLACRDARLLHHRRADRIRGDGARARRPGRARHRRRLDRRRTAGCRSIRPAGSRPRAIRSAPPASRCTRWPRCSSPARPATCR